MLIQIMYKNKTKKN